MIYLRVNTWGPVQCHVVFAFTRKALCIKQAVLGKQYTWTESFCKRPGAICMKQKGAEAG